MGCCSAGGHENHKQLYEQEQDDLLRQSSLVSFENSPPKLTLNDSVALDNDDDDDDDDTGDADDADSNPSKILKARKKSKTHSGRKKPKRNKSDDTAPGGEGTDKSQADLWDYPSFSDVADDPFKAPDPTTTKDVEVELERSKTSPRKTSSKISGSQTSSPTNDEARALDSMFALSDTRAGTATTTANPFKNRRDAASSAAAHTHHTHRASQDEAKPRKDKVRKNSLKAPQKSTKPKRKRINVDQAMASAFPDSLSRRRENSGAYSMSNASRQGHDNPFENPFENPFDVGHSVHRDSISVNAISNSVVDDDWNEFL